MSSGSGPSGVPSHPSTQARQEHMRAGLRAAFDEATEQTEILTEGIVAAFAGETEVEPHRVIARKLAVAHYLGRIWYGYIDRAITLGQDQDRLERALVVALASAIDPRSRALLNYLQRVIHLRLSNRGQGAPLERSNQEQRDSLRASLDNNARNGGLGISSNIGINLEQEEGAANPNLPIFESLLLDYAAEMELEPHYNSDDDDDDDHWFHGEGTLPGSEGDDEDEDEVVERPTTPLSEASTLVGG